MSLLHQIEDIAHHYSNGSKQTIAEFILKENGKLNKYSLQEIAGITYSSKPALIRFAKALGYSGWTEFVNVLVEEVAYQEQHYSDIDPNFPFAEDSGNEDIINQMCSLQVESILDTADLLSKAPLDEVAILLERQKRIVVFGATPNCALAELFSRKMLSIGRNVEVPGDTDNGLKANSMRPEDCAIIISYSGSTLERRLPGFYETLKNRGVPIVAITSIGANDLSRCADYVLPVSSREHLFSKIATFSTEMSIMCVLNALFAFYFRRDYENNQKRKEEISRKFETINRYSNEKEQL